MDQQLDPRQLSNWLAEIVSTQPEEIDCDALAQVMEQLVALAESTEDVREVLPVVAVHLDHCPECRDWFETLRALASEINQM